MTEEKECFRRFLDDAVDLSNTRRTKLQDTSRAVETVLRSSGEANLTVLDARPQGSYAQKTIINPKDENYGFDADLLVQCEDIDDPVELLRASWRTLNASPYYAGKVSRKSRCVTINYAGEFHLDVVPAVKRNGALHIVNRNAQFEWLQLEATDPDGFTKWLDDADEHAKGHLIAAIRLVKWIRTRKSRPALKSVVMTFLLAEAAKRRSTDEFVDLPTTLTILLEEMASWWSFYGGWTLTEPTCGSELRMDGVDRDVVKRQLDRLAVRAREAHDAETDAAMVRGWRKLFGDRFPAPRARKAGSLTLLERGEQDLWKDYGIPTVRGPETVQLNATFGEGDRRVPLRARPSIPRHRDLRFEIASTTVEAPYDVFWKVKNSGAAALQAGQMRGEIAKSRSDWKKESTRWPGRHYVEAYIVKDGICVATAREPVVIA